MTVAKVIELVGSSTEGWKEAAENALKEAAKTVRNIVGIDVVGCTAKVEKNKIVSYRANVKIAFIPERP
ncbi:dodecin domain-containing protein [Candidatus Bathyarchaeota archaeon]|nr:dodecin domain-containing protein [Candidatus Bathyarchaeota archaeon]MCK4474302.1 dodecin domain-containing protein [Candidatus Bathyarchaeota archaeon]